MGLTSKSTINKLSIIRKQFRKTHHIAGRTGQLQPTVPLEHYEKTTL